MCRHQPRPVAVTRAGRRSNVRDYSARGANMIGNCLT
jgi:hypothetical protein